MGIVDVWTPPSAPGPPNWMNVRAIAWCCVWQFCPCRVLPNERVVPKLSAPQDRALTLTWLTVCRGLILFDIGPSRYPEQILLVLYAYYRPIHEHGDLNFEPLLGGSHWDPEFSQPNDITKGDNRFENQTEGSHLGEKWEPDPMGTGYPLNYFLENQVGFLHKPEPGSQLSS